MAIGFHNSEENEVEENHVAILKLRRKEEEKWKEGDRERRVAHNNNYD